MGVSVVLTDSDGIQRNQTWTVHHFLNYVRRAIAADHTITIKGGGTVKVARAVTGSPVTETQETHDANPA